MHLPQRRRLQHGRILFFISGVMLCCLYTLTFKTRLEQPWAARQKAEDPGTEEEGSGVLEIDIQEVAVSNSTEAGGDAVIAESTQAPPLVITVNRTDLRHCIYVEPEPLIPSTTPPPNTTALTHPTTTTTPPADPGDTPQRKGEYPEDIFSVQQRREGWIVLHILGMIYMFISLAIVCDEFFVPALGVITDKLAISDDVAGATFMAAGGSAPELFTSLIGVFIAHSNVGIGTIVGSAVFNILFVIGMCAIFSREMLHLTWWPLFRDVSFYIIDLIMLIVFFLDNTIMWWESVMLLMGYFTYVTFMKFNVQIERAVKTCLNKHVSIVKVTSVEELEKEIEQPPPPPPPKPPTPPPPTPPTPPPPPPPAPETPRPTHCSPKPKSTPERHDDKHKLKVRPVLQRGGSAASLHNSTLRSTIFQLMIHTLDPLGEEMVFSKDLKGRVPRRARRARNKVKPEVLKAPFRGKVERRVLCRPEGVSEKSEHANSVSTPGTPPGHAPPPVPATPPPEPSTSQTPKKEEETTEPTQTHTEKGAAGSGGADGPGGSEDGESGDGDTEDDDDEPEDDEEEDEEEEDEEDREDGEDGEDDGNEEEPLSLEWPDTRRKQVTYLFLLPIVFPLWLTVPDVRNPASQKYFAMTFIGSILWIAVFSYLMVWWAHQVGETVGISEEIMGLTILAAGTSIPDLITSVIVARKGLGDMAVSSSVGSNIFDITVGLPVPWLIYSLSHGASPVMVSSNGLFCAIVLLFLMLLFVIISIGICHWKMSKKLGLTMFLLYFLFLVLSVMLEDRMIICPISI